jgi:hypothetical protein
MRSEGQLFVVGGMSWRVRVLPAMESLKIGFVDERSALSLSQVGFGIRARAHVHVKVVRMSWLIWNNYDEKILRRMKKVISFLSRLDSHPFIQTEPNVIT